MDAAADTPGRARRVADDPLGIAWVREPPSRRGYRRDAVTALILAVGTSVSLILSSVVGIFGEPVNPWASIAWMLVLGGSIAFRRRWPATIAAVVTVTFLAGRQWLSIPEQLFANINLFLALYTLGAWGTNRLRATVVRLVIIVGMLLWLFVSLFLAVTQPGTLPTLSRAGTLSPFAAFGLIQVFTNLLYFGAAYYFGDSAYQSARHRAALEARTRELSLEREHSAAQAVALERVRIARDLHDVVAHHVSVMGVQAGAARRVLDRDPAQAKESLAAIESSARKAVDELHTMLTTLRDDAGADVMGAPDPASLSANTLGVEQLPELAATARASGLRVTLTTVGTARPVPATICLSLYRIAQESLTNARKHAGANAEIDMRLRYLSAAVELEVSDNGTAPSAVPSSASAGAGLGRLGMRERVAAVGGEIEMGPKARGGYLVRARFPVAPDARAESVRTVATVGSFETAE